MKKRGEREIEMIHFENKELSGDEEDGESNDARNSSKKRRRGTILKLTHRPSNRLLWSSAFQSLLHQNAKTH